MVTKIQKSQAGIDTLTDAICMNPGESFSSNSLTNKVTNVKEVTFTCTGGAAVCSSGNPPPIDIGTGNSITAKSSVKFKALISCTPDGSDYNCQAEIQSA
jgi:hypothetical protein